MRTILTLTLGAALAGSNLAAPKTAEACGCFSPPADPVNFAVNQQSEQIIFEVHGDGRTTAHISIRYVGSPESFAWLLPVPNVPELALSSAAAFGVLDDLTRPIVSVGRESLCPGPAYVCEYHEFPDCPDTSSSGNGGDDVSQAPSDPGAIGFADAGSNSAPELDEGTAVEVLSRVVVGSYDTVTFAATDAMATMSWLATEGFIVNETMTPFMQPYLDAGMAFVAAKLLPGAGVDEIRPLAVTYEGNHPMIPLQLTAVAAEPEMTVTALIYGNAAYQPVDHPVIAITPEWISESPAGRTNYPMVLSRAVDEAGGDGFVMEYQGAPPLPTYLNAPCCGEAWDQCGVGSNGQCECPGDAFDASDCEETGLVEGTELLVGLATRNRFLTRLTTRLSSHEMVFDPMFETMDTPPGTTGRLTLRGTRKTLSACEGDIVEREEYDLQQRLQICATTYCGEGSCVVNDDNRAGCLCNEGFTARTFTDLDGGTSITCLPETPIVDLEAGGLELADACAGVRCGRGECIDLGGFATCQCEAGAGAGILDAGGAPICATTILSSEGPGARDQSAKLEDIRVCAQAPSSSCGEWGWLVPNPDIERRGVLCASSLPDVSRLVIPPPPTCADMVRDRIGDDYPTSSGSGCSANHPLSPFSAIAALAVVGFLSVSRRRRH